DAKQYYTMPEIIDLINDCLLAEKYIIIRRPSAFTLVPADDEIDPLLVPRIRVEDLDKYGKSEIVSTIKELKQQNADEFEPEVKKMMGPFGKVVLLSKTNQLLLQDSVGNLRQIMDIIDKNEASDTSLAETYSYKCRYI